MSADLVDLVIVGAGPAGLSAAVEARSLGLQVLLLDEQRSAGGQIYRGVDVASARQLSVLGRDYAAGAALTDAFKHCGASHVAGAAVWNVSRDRTVNYLQQGRNLSVRARHIILATGAMERPFPIAGWTLPGVMGAGAAQILYKNASALPSEPVVLAGCGPLLYLLACQYLAAGVTLKAVVQTTQTRDYLRAARYAAGALKGCGDLLKGLRMTVQLRRHGVRVFSAAQALSIDGTERAEGLQFTQRGRVHRIASSLILLHQGVVPNTQLSLSLNARHSWSDMQLCWLPDTDADGQIDDIGIYIAGDSRGIVGAKASALQGRRTAIAVARRLFPGKADYLAALDARLRGELRGMLHIRPFLDALYRPALEHRVPPQDSVIVCRCEEVSAGQLRRFTELGCQGPNQTKAFGRCGMGPCQGRLCGLTVTEVIAHARAVPPGAVGYYRVRPPIKPITLGELSGP